MDNFGDNPPVAPPPADDTQWQVKADNTDALVAQSRAQVPQHVTDERKNARLSMGELNARDWTDILPLLEKQNPDYRGPITKIIDLVDVPRNTILSTVFPKLEEKKRLEGETGTFGRGTVRFSDVLGELGMRPGLIRGVIGFAGDVATDPLTYIGAPAVGAAGKGAAIGKAGFKAAKGLTEAVEAGKDISGFTRTAQDVHLAAIAKLAPEATNAEKAAATAQAFFGSPTISGVDAGISTTDRVINSIKNIGKQQDRGGIFDAIRKNGGVDALTDAQKAFYAEHGLGMAGTIGESGDALRGVTVGSKGIGFGNAQQAIAHVPFTDTGIYVPAFSRSGTTNLVNRALAMAKNGHVDTAEAVASAGVAMREGEVLGKAREAITQEPDHVLTVDPLTNQWAPTPNVAKTAAMDANRAAVNQLVQDADGRLQKLADAKPGAFSPLSVADMQATSEAIQATKLAAAASMAEVEASPFYKTILDRFQSAGATHATAVDEAHMRNVRDSLIEQTRIIAGDDPARLAELHARYDDAARAMVNMTDEDIANHAAMVDAHLQNFRLKSQYANALQGSLFDQLKRPERELVDTVRGALGLSPDVIGGDFMAGKVSSVLKMFGRDHEAMQAFNWINGVGADVRAGIGNRQAANNVVRNVAEHILRNGGRQEVESVLQPIIADLRGVGSKDGKSLAGKYEIGDEHLDELMSLWGARVYQIRHDADPTRFATHVVQDGALVEGPLSQRLRAAAENGMFDGKFNNGQYAGLLKDVDAMAQKTVKVLDQLDLIDKYNASRAGYVPNLLTPMGAQEARRAALTNNVGGEIRGVMGQMAEGFQKARTSDLYQWQDAEGVWHQLQEGDFSWGGLPESQYRNVGLTPERVQAIDHAKGEIASFEKTYPGLDPETRWKLLAKNADPWTLNELAQTRYSALTGGSPIVSKLFSDNMLHLIVGRVQQEVNAAARDSWRSLLGDTALYAPGQLEKTMVRSANGTDLVFDNGVKGRIMHSEGETPTKVRVGDVVYRKVKLPESDLTEPNLTKGLMSERDLQTWVPEQTAEFIERIVGAGRGEKNLNSILKLSESVTSMWKTATLIHPSWIAGNVVGIAWNAAAFGVPIDGMIKHMRDAWRTVVAGGDLTKLEGRSVSLSGREARLGDLAVDMDRSVSGASKGDEILDHARGSKSTRYSEDIGNPKTAMEKLSGMVPAIRSELAKRIELHADQYRLNGMGEVPFSTKAKIMLGTIHDQAYMRSFYGPWFAFNARVEDTMRRAGYMAMLDHGYTPEAAAAKVKQAFYDFSDMTNGERAVRRHLIPFYCVPDHSEILTREGWKNRTQLRIGEDVMTYSVEKDCLEWQPCLDVASFPHDQELTVISSKRGVRLECTDNHRWAVDVHKSFVKGKWYGGNRKMVEAKDLNTHHSIIMAAEYHGKDSLLTPDQARLYGWLLTDGYWRFRGNHCEAVLFQSSKKFIEEAKRIAGGKPRNSGTGTTNFTIPVLSERVKPLLPLLRLGKDGCRTVPLKLSREAAEAMYEGMYAADGAIGFGSRAENKKHKHLACMNPAKLECFRTLALMLGKRTSAYGKRGCYISDRRTMKVADATITREHYQGIVWCPKTQNGTWVMRQNGTITTSGNTWLRNNGAAQLRLVMQDPKWINMYPKLKDAIEESIAGEDRLPQHMRPSWMREQLALQIGKDPHTRYALNLGTVIPTEPVFNVGGALTGNEGIMNLVKYFTSGLAPLPSVLQQVGAGRETFTGRTIGPNPGEGDLSLGEFLANQARPIRELIPTGPRTPGLIAAAEKGPGAFAARLIAGGRAQPFDDERVHFQLVREFKDKEQAMRKYISIAEREGDTKASLESRAKLLGLYQHAIGQGLEDQVPVWARNALGGSTTPVKVKKKRGGKGRKKAKSPA